MPRGISWKQKNKDLKVNFSSFYFAFHLFTLLFTLTHPAYMFPFTTVFILRHEYSITLPTRYPRYSIFRNRLLDVLTRPSHVIPGTSFCHLLPHSEKFSINKGAGDTHARGGNGIDCSSAHAVHFAFRAVTKRYAADDIIRLNGRA